MITRALVPVAWGIWGVLLAASLFTLVRVLTERNPPTIGGRGLGVMVTLAILGVLAAAAFALAFAAQRQSAAGIVAMTVLLAWPGGLMIAIPAVRAFNEWRWAGEAARTGDFAGSPAAEMAQAIDRGDVDALTGLLDGRPPPNALDAAGNDLLAYALFVVRDRNGSPSMVDALLSAGADPRMTRMGAGDNILVYLMPGITANGYDVMRMLLEHGADPNAVDPETGDTPLGAAIGDMEVIRLLVEHGADPDRAMFDGLPVLVQAIGKQQWESALYLLDHGASPDNAAGNISVDYYLDSWKMSVNGTHPEGWDRVREAIAARRADPERAPVLDR